MLRKALRCIGFATLNAALAAGAWISTSYSLPQNSVSARTRIVFLGTGTPRPDPEHMGPSVAILVNGSSYIIDCGTGIVRRAEAARQKGVDGLKMTSLKTVFITHLHSDHTLGYADLIFTPWVQGRTEPLEAYGPSGLKEMTEHILAAYREDNEIRINGLEHANRTGNKVNVHEIKPAVIYKDPNVTVKAFLVKHGSWPQAFGYRFETPDRSIVISGDTSPTESVVENCNGCDVLIHEVYTETGFARSSADWQKYIRSFHTSSKELAEIATKAKPGLLILYHQMYFGGPTDNEDALLKEIRQWYGGRVVSAHDLDIY